ncbi:MAG: hypothetical protein ACLR7Z_13705 [Bilophila wadsworthia]
MPPALAIGDGALQVETSCAPRTRRNGDHQRRLSRSRARSRAVRQVVFFFHLGRQVDYRAAYVVPAGEDKGLFRLWLDGVSIDVEAPFRGAFGAENVIAVAAVAHRLGLGAEKSPPDSPGPRCRNSALPVRGPGLAGHRRQLQRQPVVFFPDVGGRR